MKTSSGLINSFRDPFPSIKGFFLVCSFCSLSSLRNLSFLLFVLSATAATVNGQGGKQSDNRADQTLRGSGGINPSTLGMEMNIPLGAYPGRGINVPVNLSYSSKVWRMKLVGMTGHPFNNEENPCYSLYRAQYSENAASGWTSSLGIAYVEYTGSDTTYDGNGFPHAGGGGVCGGGTTNNSYVQRIQVHLPSGESHELRASEGPIFYPSNSSGERDMTGTYYAVDGSNLKYVQDGSGTYKLYLADGSSYDFAAATVLLNSKTIRKATVYRDLSGNQLTFNDGNATYPNGYWTDTLNRTIAAPFGLSAPPTPVVQNYQLPGIANPYKFTWKALKGATAEESGLTDFNQSLKYLGDTAGTIVTHTSEETLFHTDFDGHVVCGSGDPAHNPVVLTGIELPNGQRYRFSYNIYGEIDRIYNPFGGEERLTLQAVPALGDYGNDLANQEANRGVTVRSVYENANATPLTATYATGVENGNYKITANAPDGTRTERLLYQSGNLAGDGGGSWGFDNLLVGMAFEERAFASNGRPASKKLTTWAKTSLPIPNSALRTIDRNPRVTREESIVYDLSNANNLLSAVATMEYDGDLTNPATALNVRKVTQYDYTTTIGSLGTLEKTAETDYLNDANYAAVNLRSLPVETRLKDAAGNIKARSQMVYDEPGYGNGGSGGVRGQATTMRSWTDIAANQSVQTRAKYDGYGNPYQTVDGKGNVSTIAYDATYHCYPVSTTSAVPDPNGQTGSSTPFTSSTVYDSVTGLPTSMTDANGQTSTMEYNDPLLRPTKTTAPNGQQTITDYGAGTTPATRFVHSKTQIDASQWKEGYSFYDGLGRATKTQSVDSAGDVFALTCYDALGRVEKVSNPFRNVSSPSCSATNLEWTTSSYDELGRAVKVKTPDTAEVTTAYALATTGATIGTTTTVTDQAGKTRRSLTNALGQLKRVDEPTDANGLGAVDTPQQATSYGYDTLNNLITVNQGSQTRSFGYDSLSRLKQASNPESGTIFYNYDDNGNLTQKTDARNVQTNYFYDALNRVTNRSYANEPATPTATQAATRPVFYTYDDPGIAFSKGKLTKVVTGGSGDIFSVTEYQAFDQMGRVTQSNQTTDGMVINPMTYVYNLSGALIEEKYPSGRVVKNTLDAEGDLAQVQSKKNSNSGFQNYAGAFTYTATGAVSSLRLGNGRWESTQFNSRLQPTQIALGNVQNANNLLKLNYDYGTTANNGNVLSQQITVPTVGSNAGFTAVQNYSYDSLNRLQSANETVSSNQTWKQTFIYDRYGNRNFDTANNNTTTLVANCQAAVCNPTVSTTNNRFNTGQGYGYDAAGNVVSDPTIASGNRNFIYDGENKQIQVSNSSGVVGQYIYDGDGKRVKKISAAEITIFVYDAGGKMVSEYSNVVASQAEAKVSYLTSDNLGTPRINTDTTGTVISRHDYHPFGEDIATAQRTAGNQYQPDAVRKQFTSYEKDNESELNYAINRYHSSSHGRFTSVDPYNIILEKEKGSSEQEQLSILITYISDPRLWNKYSYAVNNPLKHTDPDGRRPVTAADKTRIDSFVAFGNARADEITAAQGQAAGDAFRQAVTRAAAGLYQAIDAISSNARQDPTNLRALWGAIDKLGDQSWGQTVNSNGTRGNPNGGAKEMHSGGNDIYLSPSDAKCNLFVAAVYALNNNNIHGAGIGLLGANNPNGYPVNGRSGWQLMGASFGNANVPTTSDMFGSGLTNFNFTNAPNPGDIITNGHHVGIYVGHEIVISATDYAGVNTGPMGTTLAPLPSGQSYKYLTYGKP